MRKRSITQRSQPQAETNQPATGFGFMLLHKHEQLTDTLALMCHTVGEICHAAREQAQRASCALSESESKFRPQ